MNRFLKTLIFNCFVAAFLISNSAFSQTSVEKVSNYVKYLADDKLEGRFPGTKGNDDAADFIINHYKALGINPLVGGNYKLNFSFTSGLKFGANNSASFDVLVERPGVEKEYWKNQKRNWTVGTDYIPMRFSDNGSVEGELAFVGFGTTNKTSKYDDYENIDVKGKIVIILSDSAEGKPMYSKLEDFSNFNYKILNAREHGAIGVIFVKLNSDSSNLLYPLYYDRNFNNTGIIAIQANRTSLSTIFPRNMNLYPTEQEIMKKFKPKSFILPNVKVKLTVDLAKDLKDVPNVLAVINGTDKSKSEEYIVVGAHFDHLGWGTESSTYKGKIKMIHNGADDNASGTAGVMELAERFKNNPLSRPVIVMNFNAEELGLLGSSAIVKDAKIPKDKIAFMMNLDMIGRLKENKMNVFGTGTSPKFASLVDSLGTLSGLSITKSSDGFAPSDHSSFYANGIPVLFLFTGVHNDYHSPYDDWEKINFDGLVKTVDYAETIIRNIDKNDKKPDYVRVEGATPPAGGGGRHSGVWFGIVPDFAENPNGMKISGTSAGSPAQDAGLLNEDVITKIDGVKIKNLQDLTVILKNMKPGDKVKVEYLRNGKEEVTEVTLKKRN
jgi:Iap family predicted aminopeptidase